MEHLKLHFFKFQNIFINVLNSFQGAGVAQLVTTLQTSLPVRVRIPAIPKRPWLRSRGPAPCTRWFQWKICRGPLDEQRIPRGCARAVQPGTWMPFPNLYRCNKVLVNQIKNKWTAFKNFKYFIRWNFLDVSQVVRIVRGNSKTGCIQTWLRPSRQIASIFEAIYPFYVQNIKIGKVTHWFSLFGCEDDAWPTM
jgi:hypothetical protein